LALEKDVEWSIRDLIYRNYETGMSVNNVDIIALLRKNYHEYKNSGEISQLTDTILIHLMEGGILTLAGRNEHDKVYRISSIPTRYQCTECNQISYIGDKEERKCFSCESENLRERNVR
jgi:hypothetical protein